MEPANAFANQFDRAKLGEPSEGRAGQGVGEPDAGRLGFRVTLAGKLPHAGSVRPRQIEGVGPPRSLWAELPIPVADFGGKITFGEILGRFGPHISLARQLTPALVLETTREAHRLRVQKNPRFIFHNACNSRIRSAA